MLEHYITSFIDGRVRLRHELLRKPALAEQVQSMLPTIQGIRSVAVNTRTGSLLVEYDPAILGPEQLLALLRQWEHMTGLITDPAEGPSTLASIHKSVCRGRLRRVLNGGMLLSLAASTLMGAAKRTQGHVLMGGLFLALNAVHLWNVRKTL